MSLTFERRFRKKEKHSRIFVVSRDKRIIDIVPEKIGNYTYINHYSDTNDFESNMASAQRLIDMYRDEARLIITTFLHCALPAIAMGIPVVVFYPENTREGHESDKERFSSLKKLIPVYRFSDVIDVNWTPSLVDASELKLTIVDHFRVLTQRWPLPEQDVFEWLLPSSELAPPGEF